MSSSRSLPTSGGLNLQSTTNRAIGELFTPYLITDFYQHHFEFQESGKSTTVKNFQIAYAPNAWKTERKTWRAVIYLNLVRSVRRILALLDESHVAAGGSSYKFNTTEALDETLGVDDDAAQVPTNLGLANGGGGGGKSHSLAEGALSSSTISLPATGPLPSHLIELSLRLSPLGPVEDALIAALSSDDPSSDDYEAVHLGAKDLLKGKANGRETALSASHWRRTLRKKLSETRVRKSGSGSSGSHKRGSMHSSSSSQITGSTEDQTVGDALNQAVEYDIVGTLRACSDDILRLWKDPYVRDILKKRRFRPQDSSGLCVPIPNSDCLFLCSKTVMNVDPLLILSLPKFP